MAENTEEKKESINFIHQIIEEDNKTGKFAGKVHTRFPPEPNGYLHIGHAKSICLNFGTAKKYNGLCNLRFDDTNPTKESDEYVNSIMEDVKWLGFDWEDRRYHASDYFDQLYEYAQQLIKKGKAYVDSLSSEDFAKNYKGTPTKAGKNSPFRDRSVEENLDLFDRMRKGEFPDGAHVVRAKIDMAHPNMHMRDPSMYRIKHAHHHRTGDKWHIYPMYDFAHGLSDSIEGITHSLCTLEFEVHRPLYDWFIDELGVYHPQQIEFARLNLNYTVMSKRKLLELVEEGYVDGWNDPRLPTISGLRRRGYTPSSIRTFADRIGVAKRDNIIDVGLLEWSVREDLNKIAPRKMGVLRPLKLIITNYPEDKEELMDATNNPEDPDGGTRKVPFSREIYIEQSDFMEDPPKKFFRMGPGREVRLKYAYIIECVDFKKDPATGEILEVYCTYDPLTKSGEDQTGKKVKSTLSWVSAKHAYRTEVRLYDRLFNVEDPSDVEEGEDWKKNINPGSLEIIEAAALEPSLAQAKAGVGYQFERQGYFTVDTKYSTPDKLVFNRTVTLKDDWAKIQQAGN
ncbi:MULTISPECIES: glutamine--tRNA ligase/YqeY domain fusion protein [unclassified Imperialibacter]|uniref:glutamine--tRNA ligase/YqeY domain fusion protein n=1 Tax=unclassified Imperialibacter TaxID=2629706 RepID=UPI001259523E|nr:MULTISPECIES: glutamine--tRNA ligase/YqeY domain fusion protein [unclassified Imperialibacter]CAD5258511.1 glutamyl-tRNA synthetase [Imperialibacter sp. 75]CAD5261642.1 glutamyl-tRNA synthetase [Imperialibacter sp. 89]VVT24607.1 glutamyl-tRNA synthetase [Imperialibacter sp. EC-SDR9]